MLSSALSTQMELCPSLQLIHGTERSNLLRACVCFLIDAPIRTKRFSDDKDSEFNHKHVSLNPPRLPQVSHTKRITPGTRNSATNYLCFSTWTRFVWLDLIFLALCCQSLLMTSSFPNDAVNFHEQPPVEFVSVDKQN